MGKAPSLDEFAEAHEPRPGVKSYLDSLPDDLQAQLLASKAGHSTAAKWLNELGYEKATQDIVSRWRRKRGWSGD
jgi:beta-phosphoglucomutase-like phosphatase (HAD superfamily)